MSILYCFEIVISNVLKFKNEFYQNIDYLHGPIKAIGDTFQVAW